MDNKTIFVDTMNGVAYTGYKEVPNVDNAEIAYVMDGKIASVVFILDGDIYDSASTYFMLKDTKRESFRYDGDDFWTYANAYVNGEKTPLNIKYNADKSGSNVLKADTLYKVTKTVDEEYITEVTSAGMPAKKPVVAVGIDAFWAGAAQTSSNKYDVNDETVFVVVDYALQKDGTYELDSIYDGRLDDMDDDDYNIQVQVLKQDEETAELVYIYRHEKAAPADPKVTDVTLNGEAVSTYTSAEQAYKNAIEWNPSTRYSVDADGNGTVTVTYMHNFTSGDSYTGTTWGPAPVSGGDVAAGTVTVIEITDKIAATGETDVKYIAVKGSTDMVTLTITNTGSNPVLVSVDGGKAEELVASTGSTTVDVVKGASVDLDVKVGNNGTLGTVSGSAGASVYGKDGDFTVSISTSASAPTVSIANT